MKTRKNTTKFVNDDFDIDAPESPELADEFFKNAVSFSELPQDLQIILNGIQNENKKTTKHKKSQILGATIL
ncbi:MAG: hypothetical protein PHQ03_07645 [Methylococcales bacterium]|nr:hypothetical protein [Methylococcales bacterium]